MDIKPTTGLENPLTHFTIMFLVPAGLIFLFAYKSLQTISELRQGTITVPQTNAENTIMGTDTARQTVNVYDTLITTVPVIIYDTQRIRITVDDGQPTILAYDVERLRDSVSIFARYYASCNKELSNCRNDKARFKNEFNERYKLFQNRLKNYDDADSRPMMKAYVSFLNDLDKFIDRY
jgi:hypothetical protein